MSGENGYGVGGAVEDTGAAADTALRHNLRRLPAELRPHPHNRAFRLGRTHLITAHTGTAAIMRKTYLLVYACFADRSPPFLSDVLEVNGACGADATAGGAAELAVAGCEIQLRRKVRAHNNHPIRTDRNAKETMDAGLRDGIFCGGWAQNRTFSAQDGRKKPCSDADKQRAQDTAALLKGYRRHLLPPLNRAKPQRSLWADLNAGEAIDAGALGDSTICDGAGWADPTAGVAFCAAVLGQADSERGVQGED